MTDNTVVLEDDYLAAARELRTVTAERKALDAREAKAKEIIAKHLAEGDTGVDPDTGELLVQVRRGARRWDDATAMKTLPADLAAMLTVTKTVTSIDKDKAKDVLAPALYEACCKAAKPSVVAL